MAADEVVISLLADIGDLISKMGGASDAVVEAMDKMKAAAQSTGEALSDDLANGAESAKKSMESVKEETFNLGKAFEELKNGIHSAFEAAGLLLMVEAARQAIEVFEEVSERVSEISSGAKELEVTTGQFQLLSETAKESGASMNIVERAVIRLNTVMEEAKEHSGTAIISLQKFGITSEDLNNKLFGTNEALMRVSASLQNEATHEAAVAEAHKLFGVRAAEAIEIFEKYPPTIQGVQDAITELNGATDKEIEKINAARATWENFKTTVDNVKVTFLANIIDMINGVGEFYGAYSEVADFNPAEAQAEAVAKSSKQAIASAKALAQELGNIENDRNKELMEAEQFATKVTEAGSLYRVQAARAEYEATLAYYGGDQKVAQVIEANERLSEATKEWAAKEIAIQQQVKDATAKAQEETVAASIENARKILDAQLSNKQISPETYYAAQKIAIQNLEAAEVHMYQVEKAALPDTQANAAKRIELDAEIAAAHAKAATSIQEASNKETSAIKKNSEDAIKAELEQIKTTEALALAQQESAKKILDAQLSNKQISPETYEIAMIQVLKNIEAAQEAAANAQIADYQKQRDAGFITQDEYVAKVKQANADIEKSQEQLAAQIVETQDKAEKEVLDNWKKITTPFENAFTSALDGILQGTENFHQAMRKMFDQLGLDIVNGAVHQMLSGWLTALSKQVASSQEASSVLKALHLSDLSVAETTQKTQSASQITDNAAVAASAAEATAAAVPGGFATAPEIASEIYSDTLAWTGALAERGALLDQDMVVGAHANEMILPAKISQGIQDKILQPEGVGQSTPTVNHYHIDAHDSRSFEKYVNQAKNRNILMNAVKKANSRGNRAVPSLR